MFGFGLGLDLRLRMVGLGAVLVAPVGADVGRP
jgi:hypothetical protein